MGKIQDILEVSFDTGKTAQSKAAVIADLKEVFSYVQKFSDLKIELNTGGLKGLVDFEQKFIKLTGESTQAVAASNKSLIEAEKVQQAKLRTDLQAEKLAQQRIITLKLEEEQTRKTAKAHQEAGNIPFTHNLNSDGTVNEPGVGVTSGSIPVSAQDKKEVEALTQLQVIGRLTNEEYQNSFKRLSPVLTQVKKSTADLRIEEERENKIKLEASILAQKEAAAIKNLIREENAEVGSIERLRLELTRLTAQYDQLSAAERSSASGQGLKTQVAAITTQVKTLEAESGRVQKSVAGAGGALASGASKAFGFIRQIAYVLPGIGIAGIIGALSDGIVTLVQKLFTAKEAYNAIAEKVKLFNDVNKEANQLAGKEITDAKILYKAATDVNLSMKDRKRAVAALKEEFPDYFKNVETETILNGKAQKSYDDLVKSLKAASRAEAAKGKIANIESQLLDIDNQKRKIESAIQQQKDRAADTFTSSQFTQGRKVIQTSKKEAQDFLEVQRKKAINEQDVNAKRLQDQEDFLFKYAGLKNLEKNVSDKQLKDPKAKKNNKDYLDDIIKARQDAARQLILIQEDLNKAIVDKDGENFQARLDALKSFQNLEVALLEFDKQAAIKVNEEKYDNELKQEHLSSKQKQQIRQASLLNQINIEAKFGRDIAKLKIDQAKTTEDFISKNELRSTDKRVETQQEINKRIYDTNQEAQKFRLQNDEEFQQRLIDLEIRSENEKETALLERYKAGLVNRKNFERELLDIQEESALKSLKLQKDTIETEINSGFFDAKTVEKLQNKLADINKKIAEATTKTSKKDQTERLADLRAFLEAAAEIESQVAGIIGSAIDVGITKQKNALQELEDKRQEAYDNELTRINGSTLSETDKAIALNKLEKQRNAQKAEFDRKTREADNKKAKFDKAQAIAQIIIQTALAVVKALPVIPLAVLAGVLGAAQLAVAIATPLPKYAKGLPAAKESHYGIYGEDGPEYIKKPGQHGYISDTPTVDFIPRGTSITPIGKDGLNAAMYSAMVRGTSMRVQKDGSIDILTDINSGIKKLTRKNTNIQNIIQVQINPHHNYYSRK